ncbi:hypothetical protein, partial [Janthinobacterium sp. SUN033]|uniref:hypothetical protein n=1 Tax=Janthinobacterium sp. SUN033 TaxID=3002439 RepID=UPI0025AF54A1
FIISCEHLIYFKYYSNPKIAAALTSNAHTYRLLIVKELYSVLLSRYRQSVVFVSCEEGRV